MAGALAAIAIVMNMGKSGATAVSSGYMDGPIKVGVIAAVFWGIAGFLIGDIIAWQLAFPALNFD